MKGMFRTGWVRWTTPRSRTSSRRSTSTGASSNDGDYSNPAFDTLLTEAAPATDPAAAEREVPGGRGPARRRHADIPMWYGKATFGWSDKVTDVRVITAFGPLDYSSISLK